MLKAALLTALAVSAATAADLRTEYLNNIAGLEKKYVGLAEAVPAEKYSYRPAPGVRSVSEVLMHVAGANYMIPRSFGVTPPEGLSQGMEKSVTDKAEVLKHLRASFEHVRKAAEASGKAEEEMKLFGMAMSHRGGLTFLTNHLHEHLGQFIAYARANNVRPPWARGAE